jgi:propanediol dehydratase small subunit
VFIGLRFYGFDAWCLSSSGTIDGFTLDEGTEASVTVDGEAETAQAGAAIQINIDPGRPYLVRNIRRIAHLVTPKTYRTWQDIFGVLHAMPD